MKEIQLTQDKVALVDDEDYEYLNQFKWYAATNSRSKKWYARRHYTKHKPYKKISMHREILNAPPHLQIDHINGDGLDNRRGNLRLCTPNENTYNTRRSIGVSKYKGVCWDKRRDKWFARISKDGKYQYLGTFRNEEEAAIAYDKAAVQLFGAFANLNILSQEFKECWSGVL